MAQLNTQSKARPSFSFFLSIFSVYLVPIFIESKKIKGKERKLEGEVKEANEIPRTLHLCLSTLLCLLSQASPYPLIFTTTTVLWLLLLSI